MPRPPKKEIKELNLFVLADAINSGGAVALPKLLEKLNIRYKIINSEIEGVFNHTPEPLAENLIDLSQEIIKNNADFFNLFSFDSTNAYIIIFLFKC